MIKKTIGGDRLGSGNKMKAALHNYERSTHDLGNAWRTTMAPGVLVPFYKKICTNGDTWTINLNHMIRTMPAIGPLFGQYKLQLDFFECPIRLYNGILHNNMIKVGMDSAKVKFPTMTITQVVKNKTNYALSESEKRQVSTSALWHYLGLKGTGDALNSDDSVDTITTEREIQCIPLLAYYDIFKNYYANKQEENAYVINNDIETLPTLETNGTSILRDIGISVRDYKLKSQVLTPSQAGTTALRLLDWDTNTITGTPTNGVCIIFDNSPALTMDVNNNYIYSIHTKYKGSFEWKSAKLMIKSGTNRIYGVPMKYPNIDIYQPADQDTFAIRFNDNTILTTINNIGGVAEPYTIMGINVEGAEETTNTIKLERFKLENIDTCRIEILRNTALNTTYSVNSLDLYPYKANYEVKADGNSNCKNTMAGLVVKTYQSDIFNNWLSTDWISGINGISTITSVDVSNGSLNLDALNLKQKVYNMLNRIAVSGGTYEDWQEAVYGEDALRRAESPIYCGGASGIIAFEEVVSTADTETETAGDQPLGSLAGKGLMINAQGGHVEIHIKEPSYIMGIASITPYIDYCQGNDFDLTEIYSLDDLHKPELDEIGFQDLLLERAAWWGTIWDDDNKEWTKYAGGKLPAWIDYMTSVNEVHGEFAEKDKLGFMVLTRDYEMGNSTFNGSRLNNLDPLRTIPVKDWTTYVNPTKFNYQFADTSLSAQNFWVQLGINAECRRKISAKLIPNL